MSRWLGALSRMKRVLTPHECGFIRVSARNGQLSASVLDQFRIRGHMRNDIRLVEDVQAKVSHYVVTR